MKDEDVIKEMFKFFDQDGNEAIDEKEFMKGVQDYLDKAMKAVDSSQKSRALEEFEKVIIPLICSFKMSSTLMH